MKPYHPDDSGMIPRTRDRNRNNGGGNGFAIITPAETRRLAGDMSDEFGGGANMWRRNLNQRLPDYKFGGGHGGGGGNKNPGGGNNGGGLEGGNDVGSVYGPHRGVMPMQMKMPGVPMNAPMAMQIPQQGLLNAAPMQMQQPQQQQGLLGDIPPEVLAFLRSRGV